MQLSEKVDFEAGADIVRPLLWETWRYPEFISHMETAEIIHETPNETEVLFRAHLFMQVTYSVKTWMGPGDTICFEQKTGLGTVRGRWSFEYADEAKCGWLYEVTADVPPLVPGLLVDSLIRIHFPNMLREFEREARRRAGTG